jgi:hypothetical protein
MRDSTMITPGQTSKAGNTQLVKTRSQLAEYLKTAEDNLRSIKEIEMQLMQVGDDAQLANIDLQNMLQKQQQTIQMMSNISKTLHDTALSVIRKIGS